MRKRERKNKGRNETKYNSISYNKYKDKSIIQTNALKEE
jgi:hypothetical protein